jgi:hypothetical protein
MAANCAHRTARIDVKRTSRDCECGRSVCERAIPLPGEDVVDPAVIKGLESSLKIATPLSFKGKATEEYFGEDHRNDLGCPALVNDRLAAASGSNGNRPATKSSVSYSPLAA